MGPHVLNDRVFCQPQIDENPSCAPTLSSTAPRFPLRLQERSVSFGLGHRKIVLEAD